MGARKRKRWLKVSGVLLILAIAIGILVWYKLFREVDQPFDSARSPEEFYKYGSIGTEGPQGMPYWIWLALPRMFPEYLPGPGGYNSLGFYNEPGKDLPVGFSVKTIGFARVGINCAFCHSATVRLSAADSPRFIPGGPSTTVDVLGYERFLFRCASDPRFNSKNILAEIGKMYTLSPLDRALYRLLVPVTRKALLKQKEMFVWTESRPPWGRGRIDPFNPVKVAVLHVPVGDTIGNSDMVPIWNLKAHEGMAYHWDGLNTHIEEVVRSSSIGDGATAKTIPLQDLENLQEYFRKLPPPKYPGELPINRALAAAGKAVFDRECGSCHAPGGAHIGQVVPVDQLGTDPHRVAIWTKEAADAYNAYAKNYAWKFSNFRSTNGYVCVLLDGIWARGPYLHNGSVPSLHDLLEPPEKRPRVFYRGFNVFDPKNVGFVSQGPEAEQAGERYDVTVPANSNRGHLWGTNLGATEKEALVEYMKTL